MSLLDRFCAMLRTRASMPSMLLFFAGMYLLSQVSIAVVLDPVGIGRMLALQTTLSVDDFRAMVTDLYERDVVEAYLAHYYYDYLHPLWYSTLLALVLAAGMNRAALSATANRWLLVPFMAGLMDIVENSLHIYMVVDTANIAPAPVLIGNGAALLKWVLVGLCLIAVLVLFMRRSHKP